MNGDDGKIYEQRDAMAPCASWAKGGAHVCCCLEAALGPGQGLHAVRGPVLAMVAAATATVWKYEPCRQAW